MLEHNIQYLKGVGPKRASLLNRMGIFSVRDFIGYFPREYEDRRKPIPISSIVSGQKATIRGKVEDAKEVKLNMKLSVFRVRMNDGTGVCFGSFFRKINPYSKFDIFSSLKKIFVKDAVVFLNGLCENNLGQKNINIEEYELFVPGVSQKGALIHFGRIVPIYPLTEGISQKWIREAMFRNIDRLAPEWPEILPEGYAGKKTVVSPRALLQIHFPDEFKDAETARQKLAFDEFLVLETALTLARSNEKRIGKERSYELKRNLLTPFKEKLGFEFTAAQKKVINEIFRDLENEKPMNRLLMGDVGSGKTVVALSAVLYVLENGYQAVIIAPTEILAEQHYLTISNILEGLPVKAALLTGRLSGKKGEKQRALSDIASGETNLVIGTHAVLEKNVGFKNLALVVVDEQHKFGVVQRAELRKKSENPDVLVMTATPIPRTLALTVYGDMDISTIGQLPPGRLPVKTMRLGPSQAYALVKQELKKGNKAYIVYPLVEESDKLELKAAVKESETLSKSVFSGFKVGLVHGQMKTDEREHAMLDFRSGKYDILIATTVIEVGIDVGDATVMVIEHADRFGLATLHQLRGRIGRGPKKSYCVLLGEPKTEQSKERMSVMLETSDGFKIAEKDLLIRGPGEFFGTAQSGILSMRAGNIVTDFKLINESRDLARNIVETDPLLEMNEHKTLKNEIDRTYAPSFGLFKVG